MSTKISKKAFKELLQKLIQREIDEVSTTATAGGEYDTPNAFSGKGKDRRNSVASGSGFEKVNEIRAVAFQGLKDSEGQMWDLFWREKPPYVIPFNARGPKTKVKDITDTKLKKTILKVLKNFKNESVNETLPNRVWMDLRKKYSTNELKRFFKKESVNESGIMYRAGVKKYGKEGMTKIQQAAGKGLGHEEIGKIKDKYDKTKKETAEVTEDTKDIAKAKQISRQLEKIESKYRKAMYDLSDRLQADPKNHKLQDDLVKSYTKNVTSFMRDMIKITKRMK